MPIPFTDLENVKKVMNYRKKKRGNETPMSFRAIAEEMEKDVKTVYRWYMIGTGKKTARVGESLASYPQVK